MKSRGLLHWFVFFELDRCLSHHLSLYFDDEQSPEKCGHCSVCRGQVAKLAYSTSQQWPDDQQISHALKALTKYISAKAVHTSLILQSTENYSRFLAGLSVPVFSRYKIRQLAGFGLCADLRYEEIRQKVQSLTII